MFCLRQHFPCLSAITRNAHALSSPVTGLCPRLLRFEVSPSPNPIHKLFQGHCLGFPFAPPIKTSPSEAQIPGVEISSSCEVSVGGIWELKQRLKFGITSGGGQAFLPDRRGMPMLLRGEAKREIWTIIK